MAFWDFVTKWHQRSGRQFGADLDAAFDPVSGHTHDGVNSPALANNDVGTSQLKDAAVTNAKLATDVKVGSLAALTTTTKASVVAALNELDAQLPPTPGTVAAGTAVIVDANKRADALCIGALSLGAGAGTAVTATAAELNTLSGSGIVAGDVTKLHAVTASAAELNTLAGSGIVTGDVTKLHAVTATAAELNVNAGVTAGTVTASKHVVVDANKRADAMCIGTLSLGAAAGTAVTATAAEINALAGQGAVTTDIAKLHAITATAAEINALAGQGVVTTDAAKLHAITATAAEINVNAGVTAGTVTASKTLVVDANKALTGLVLSDLKLGAPVAKTTSYSCLAADTGKTFTTTGAAGAVTFTLPAVASNAGLTFQFINTVAQTMAVTAPAGTLVAFNNGAATTATWSTAGNLYGAACHVVCDGTKWLLFQDSPCTVTVT